MTCDVIVIGGSYAGMAAALQLIRARRKVLVVDGGQRRNRFAAHSHGFLGRDGKDPAEIAREAKSQLLAYPTLSWLEGRIAAVEGAMDDFGVTTEAGERHTARRLVLATGLKDELPEIEGLEARWGKTVFLCPYCHGYELNQGAIGVLATGPQSLHHALLVPEWGTVTFFLNGAFSPDEAQRTELENRGVAIESEPVSRVSGEADVELADGRSLAFAGLFTMTGTSQAAPFAQALGCEMEEGPQGPYVTTDGMQQTTVPGVFACGDMSRGAGSIALAVGDGTMAGAAAHRSLVFA